MIGACCCYAIKACLPIGKRRRFKAAKFELLEQKNNQSEPNKDRKDHSPSLPLPVSLHLKHSSDTTSAKVF
jgi:hypothetical protein